MWRITGDFKIAGRCLVMDVCIIRPFSSQRCIQRTDVAPFRSGSAWRSEEENEVGALEGLECLLDELLHLFGMDLDGRTRRCVSDDGLQQ